MIVDKSWFTFDTNLGSLVLQRLGFFSNMAPKRTTNSTEIWCNILNPEKMMDGEALMMLLEWTIPPDRTSHGKEGEMEGLTLFRERGHPQKTNRELTHSPAHTTILHWP